MLGHFTRLEQAMTNPHKVLVTNMETLLEEALNDLSDGSIPDAWTPGELGSMMMDASDKIEKALELLAEVGQKLDNA